MSRRGKILCALGCLLAMLSVGSWLAEKRWLSLAQSDRKERLLSIFSPGDRPKLLGMSFEGLLLQATSSSDVEGGDQCVLLSNPPGAEVRLGDESLGREPVLLSPLPDRELVLTTPWRKAITTSGAIEAGGVSVVGLSANLMTRFLGLLGLVGLGLVVLGYRDRTCRADPENRGERFGGYVRQQLLGGGSMGSVYMAQALGNEDGKKYALKVLLPEWSESEEFRQRFQREVTICRRLDDEGIVRVYESGETDGQLWMVMDHVEGRDLGHWLKEQSRCEDEILTMAEALCRGLQHAHDLGVVHRDLKPENILVRTDDRPVIADFGLARGTTDLTITQAHTILGTPAYMAPEQVEGRACDAQSDLYSLGAILYECFAGRPPFTGEAMEVIMATLSREPEPVSQYAGVSPGAEALVHKLLAKDKAERYRSAAEVRQALLALK